MAKYLTQQVANGTPYEDILDIHNRLIIFGKYAAFFYKYIKYYTQQLADKYAITLDWLGLPDEVEFNYNLLNYGDTVNYLNDLADVINKTKDMLYVALGQYTTFFKEWLKHHDEDNDSLADLVYGDDDIHDKPNINYDKITKTYNVGDVVYADDFNLFKQYAAELIKVLPRVFGAYYDLMKLEGLDTKDEEFANYGINVIDSALTFANKISDWSIVEPPAPDGATGTFLTYSDGHQWNTKVLVYLNEDGSQHRFMIWDYFEREYIYDSGWYPALSYLEPDDFSDFDSWYDGPYYLSSVIYNSDNNEIQYVKIKYGIYHSIYDYLPYGLGISVKKNIINLNDLTTRVETGTKVEKNDYAESGVYLKYSLLGRYIVGFVITYTLTDDDGDDHTYLKAFWVNKDSSSIGYTYLNSGTGENELEQKTGCVSHLGTGAIAFHWALNEDEYDDHLYGAIYISSDGLSLTNTQKYISDNPSYDYTKFFRIYPAAVVFGNRETDDWYGYVGVATSLGYSTYSIYYAGGFTYAYTSDYHKFIYGMALAWGYMQNDNGGNYYTTMRIDYPKYVYRGSTDPGRVGYDRSDEYIKINWRYPEIKWLIPYQYGYNIQNPRIFEDTVEYDTSTKAYVVERKYFVPKTWYGYPRLPTEDLIGHNDGSLKPQLYYWGTDGDKLSSYNTLVFELTLT